MIELWVLGIMVIGLYWFDLVCAKTTALGIVIKKFYMGGFLLSHILFLIMIYLISFKAYMQNLSLTPMVFLINFAVIGHLIIVYCATRFYVHKYQKEYISYPEKFVAANKKYGEISSGIRITNFFFFRNKRFFIEYVIMLNIMGAISIPIIIHYIFSLLGLPYLKTNIIVAILIGYGLYVGVSYIINGLYFKIENEEMSTVMLFLYYLMSSLLLYFFMSPNITLFSQKLILLFFGLLTNIYIAGYFYINIKQLDSPANLLEDK